MDERIQPTSMKKKAINSTEEKITEEHILAVIDLSNMLGTQGTVDFISIKDFSHIRPCFQVHAT